jgi:hypothetical protein
MLHVQERKILFSALPVFYYIHGTMARFFCLLDSLVLIKNYFEKNELRNGKKQTLAPCIAVTGIFT